MNHTLYDYGYRTKWTDIHIEQRDRYKTSVTDFHEHDFYEINLILSGNVKIIVEDRTLEGTDCRIVLTNPGTAHFVSCRPDILYSSLFLVFSGDFIRSYDIEFMKLLSVFGDKGAVFTLTPAEKELCRDLIHSIERETSLLRKKFLVYYLLSCLDDLSKQHGAFTQPLPQPIYEVLTYINRHCAEKNLAQDLAAIAGVSRTTLMTQFKKYTGKTVHEYVINSRMRNALRLLREGKTEYEAAVSSGFSDSSAFIQCFKRTFKMTPRQYMKSEKTT